MPLKINTDASHLLEGQAPDRTHTTEAGPARDLAACPAPRVMPGEAVRPSDGPTVFSVRAEANADSVSLDGADLGEARQDSHDAAPGGTADDADEASPEVAAFFEALLRRMPAGYVYNERFNAIVDREGCPICGPLRVVSFPRRLDGSGYATAVEFVARDGRLQKATIAQADLTRDAFLSRLIDLGLARYSSAVFVAQYIMAWEGIGYSWRADRAGWFQDPEGGLSFVRADGIVHHGHPHAAAPVVLTGSLPAGRQAVGTLEGWQHEVATTAAGNHALIFAICAALGGPLLRLAGIETVGVNLFGPSATGKSLLLRLAISAAGDPASLTPWSAAETGLHRQSTEAQDGLLAFDALPRDPGAKLLKAVLALGDDGGAGRVDASRDPDGSRRFRRIVLSTSELPISALLQRKKKSPPSALALRMIDIPATQGRHGLLDDLHGHPDGLTFARALEAAMRRHHGHLLPAFLDHLVANLDQVTTDLLEALPGLAREFAAALPATFQDPASPGPTLHLVAERFALISQAGEMAIALGLLPWPSGTAREAAHHMARLARHPDQGTDTGATFHLQSLRDYIHRHADRIIDLEPHCPAEMRDDALGWRDEDHVYLRSDEARDAFEDPHSFFETLSDCGALKPGGEARSRQYKLPATKVPGRPRVYRLDRKVIEGSSGG